MPNRTRENIVILTLVLFLAMIVLCFRAVGIAVRRSAGNEPLTSRFVIWSLGASLFAHALGFLSISYFDQNEVTWYMLLAMISIAAAPYLGRRRSAARSPQTTAAALPEGHGAWETQPVAEMSHSGI